MEGRAVEDPQALVGSLAVGIRTSEQLREYFRGQNPYYQELLSERHSRLSAAESRKRDLLENAGRLGQRKWAVDHGFAFGVGIAATGTLLALFTPDS